MNYCSVRVLSSTFLAVENALGTRTHIMLSSCAQQVQHASCFTGERKCTHRRQLKFSTDCTRVEKPERGEILVTVLNFASENPHGLSWKNQHVMAPTAATTASSYANLSRLDDDDANSDAKLDANSDCLASTCRDSVAEELRVDSLYQF